MRVRARTGSWLLLVASSLVSFGMLEAAMRVVEVRRAGQPPPKPLPLPILEPIPAGGYRLKPNLDVETVVGGRVIRIRTNQHGMRWRDVPIARPPSMQRIAVLGDSFAFGCWSDSIEDSLVGVFERNISPQRWQVLNFGVGGYGPADQARQMEDTVLRFSPDFAVLVFYAGNDFRDAYLGLEKDAIVDGTAVLDERVLVSRVPASELARDSTRSLPSPPGPFRKQLERLATVRALEPLLGLEQKYVDFRVNRNFKSRSYWSQHPYPEVAARGRDAALAYYLRMDDAFRRAGGTRLGIVAIPFREQVQSRTLAGKDFDIALPQVYVQAFARDHGIPYLDLLPVFRRHLERTGESLYIDGDIHLNQAGHRLAGEQIAEWFRCCLRG